VTQDCSERLTGLLPQVSTVTDDNITGDTNINPGDALDYTADHVVLFDSWIDQSAGTFNYDAEHKTDTVTSESNTGNVYGSDLEGYPVSWFEALQYNNLTASGPTVNNATAVSSNPVAGTLYNFSVSSAGHLIATYLPPGGKWTVYDLTAVGKAPIVSGSIATGMASNPTPGTMYVFERGSNGDLYTSYLAPGGSWTKYDLTAAGDAPSITGSIATGIANNPATDTLYVLTQNASNSHLTATYLDNKWNQYDLTQTGYAPTVGGSIATGTANNPATNTLYVFTQASNGHLVTSYLDNKWNQYDLTQTGKAPTVTGSASVGMSNDPAAHTLYAFAEQSGNGHLVTSYLDSSWNQYDLTTAVGTPAM
jgi:hypothetical protein